MPHFMIKLFDGSDNYESYKACKSYANEISKQTSRTIKVINADEVRDISEVFAIFEGLSLFAEENILLLKRLFLNKTLINQVTNNFESLDKNHVILWQDSKADGKLKLVKKLKSLGRISTFEELKPWQLEKWLINIAKKAGIEVSKEVASFLFVSSLSNKALLVNELSKYKILLGSLGKNKLEKEDIMLLWGGNLNGDIWEFLDMFAARDKKCILEMEKLLKSETSIQYLIAMVARELSLILRIKEYEKENGDFKDLKLHPFVLQKTIKKAQNFSFYEIAELLQKLVITDMSIKKGELKDTTAFRIYVTTSF